MNPRNYAANKFLADLQIMSEKICVYLRIFSLRYLREKNGMMDESILALFWGLVSGGALVVGALGGYYIRFGEKAIAAIMAFGSGVLISVLSFDLMDEAFSEGGILASSIGFLCGAVVYTLANEILAKFGARHRKRSSGKLQNLEEDNGNSMGIALGALLDGIPESIVIGLSLLSGQGVSLVAVIGIFLSNLPEGLSSATGMKKAGKSKTYIFGLWIGIALISGLAAFLGYTVFGKFSEETIAGSTAFAAGAILCMIVDTMIPEAFARTQKAAGIIVTIGFLSAFFLSKSMG
jgi:ZIP family zinc transporter